MAMEGDAAVPAPLAAAVGLHGAVSAFDPDVEEWLKYVERLSHYFDANEITAAGKKRAILLNAVGPRTYRLIKTLASPAKVTELLYDELVEKASAHFCPQPSPIIKTFEFNTRVQGEGESIAEYVAALRKIAEYCEYGAVLGDTLRDRLVCGIRHKGVQRRLLQETDLTFSTALKTPFTHETTRRGPRGSQEWW